MSSAPAATRRSVPRALLTGLVDDAAVFPPASTPLDVAVEEHLRRAETSLGRFVGPLLVPAASAAEVVELAADRGLRVGLISRPGSPLGPLHEGAEYLLGRTDVELAGLEAGWSPSWSALLDIGAPVTVEIPRDDFHDALEDVALARREGAMVQAKFRTGATDSWSWPDEAELSGFIYECLERGMPFKLTGGLHHAVRGDHATEEGADPQHGLLNVLLAVHDGRCGADRQALAQVLAARDTDMLSGRVRALSDEQATRLREAFTAYGCCTVTDPLGELAELDLLPA